MTKISLERVEYIPKELKPGVLYVAAEYGAAAHLCPCGCGAKIRTPLHPTEWSVEETQNGPTLFPSVGNWQQPCRSHYWIHDGEVKWAGQWTEAQILAGRKGEERRRDAYYKDLYAQRRGVFANVCDWFVKLFK